MVWKRDNTHKKDITIYTHRELEDEATELIGRVAKKIKKEEIRAILLDVLKEFD